MNFPPHRGPDGGHGGNGQEAHITEDLCRDLLGGLLSASDRETVMAHVASCERCERFFAERVVERERLLAIRRLQTNPDGEPVAERILEAGGRVAAEEGPLRHPQTDATASGPARAIDRVADGQVPETDSPTRQLPAEILTGLWPRLRSLLHLPAYRWALPALVAAAILLIVFWPRAPEIPADAGLRWLPVSIEGLRVRAEADPTAGADLLAGFDAYARQDAQAAIAALQKTAASGQLETLRRIYLGSALAWSGRYPDAVTVLRPARARTLDAIRRVEPVG
jgi:hypothetical protein